MNILTLFSWGAAVPQTPQIIFLGDCCLADPRFKKCKFGAEIGAEFGIKLGAEFGVKIGANFGIEFGADFGTDVRTLQQQQNDKQKDNSTMLPVSSSRKAEFIE